MIEIEYGDIEIVNDLIQETAKDIVIEFEDDLQLIEETYKPYDEFLKLAAYDPTTNTIVVNGKRVNAGKIGSKKERNRINAFLRRNNFDPKTGTIEIPLGDRSTGRVPLNPGAVIHSGNHVESVGDTINSAYGNAVTTSTKIKKRRPGLHYNQDGTINVDQSLVKNQNEETGLADTKDIDLSKQTMMGKPRHSDFSLKHEAGHVNQWHRANKQQTGPSDPKSLNYPEDSSDFHDVAQLMQGVNDQERREINDGSHYSPSEFDADAFAFKHHMDPNYSGASLSRRFEYNDTNTSKKRERQIKRETKNMSQEERDEYLEQRQKRLESPQNKRNVINFVNELNKESEELTIRAQELNKFLRKERDSFPEMKDTVSRLRFVKLDPNNHSTYKEYYDYLYDVIEAFLQGLLVKKDKLNNEKIRALPFIFKLTRRFTYYIALVFTLIKMCGIDTMLLRSPYDLEDRARQLQQAYLNYQKHTQNQENQSNQRKLTIQQLEQQIASGQLTPDQVNKAKKKIQSIKQYEAGLETQKSQPTQQQDQGWDGKSPLPQGQELSKTQKKKMKQKKREEEYLALGKHVNDQMEEYRRMKASRQAALDRSTKAAPTQESYIPNTSNMIVIIYDEYGDRNGIKEFNTYEKALDYCKKQLKPKNIDYDILTSSEYKTKYGQ